MNSTTINAIDAEIDRAHSMHGRGFEDGSLDVKLRILVEEVGEVARAIQDISNADRARRTAALTGTTDQLEAAREVTRTVRAHLIEEVTQVAATAVRWLEVEMATSHSTSETPTVAASISDRSTTPCNRCGERHLLKAFPVGERVVSSGRHGFVHSWSQYGGSLSVRVEMDTRDQHGDPIRMNFAPCELSLEPF
jgi:NTP pyrophosphatase (non-canonical NTP hydrolase)